MLDGIRPMLGEILVIGFPSRRIGVASDDKGRALEIGI
jgi:hypothetical protein